MSSKLIVPIKQGEELNVAFTVKGNDMPLDLSGYTIKFIVKRVPLENFPSIIDKTITETSDPDTVGYIMQADQGLIVVHLTKEDTSFPTGDYSLIIAMEADNYYDIISSMSCGSAVYRICEQ